MVDSLVIKNAFAAIKINGTFSLVDVRSFVKQEKPYTPTAKADTVVFHLSNIQGTMVGFVTPEAAEVLNSPAQHYHFIDKGRSAGGHVLNVVFQSGTIEIDYSRELTIALPDPLLLNTIDLTKRIK